MYFLFFIPLLIVKAVDANVCQLKENQYDCGRYCYSYVKPFLPYFGSMQKRLEACEVINPSYAYDRFEKINDQLAQQLRQNELWQARLEDYQSNQQKLTKLFEDYNKNLSAKESKLNDLENQLKIQVEKVESCESSAKVTENNLNDQRNNLEKCQNERKKFTKIGKKYYYIERNLQLTWINALQKCSQWGGHLVSLQNEEEWNNLTKELTIGDRYWIDVNDIEMEGEFMSATTGKPAKFLKWVFGEPSNFNNNENCGEIGYISFAMNDASCKYLNGFICESDTEL